MNVGSGRRYVPISSREGLDTIPASCFAWRGYTFKGLGRPEQLGTNVCTQKVQVSQRGKAPGYVCEVFAS